HGHLEKRTQKPEIGNTGHGEPQRALPKNAADTGKDFAERIPPHRQPRAGGGYFAYEETGERSNDRDSEQHPAHDQRLAFPAREEERSHAGSGDSGREG